MESLPSKPHDIAAAQARMLEWIAQDERELRELMLRQAEHVKTARRLRIYWRDIAKAAGITRTTATSRWLKAVKRQADSVEPSSSDDSSR